MARDLGARTLRSLGRRNAPGHLTLTLARATGNTEKIAHLERVLSQRWICDSTVQGALRVCTVDGEEVWDLGRRTNKALNRANTAVEAHNLRLDAGTTYDD